MGGFLAGLFGLITAVFSANRNRLEQEREKSEAEQVMLHSIVTKLFDINDSISKNRRHLMIDDVSSRVRFRVGGKNRYFSKPLEGESGLIRFTIEERVFLLRKYKAKRLIRSRT